MKSRSISGHLGISMVAGKQTQTKRNRTEQRTAVMGQRKRAAGGRGLALEGIGCGVRTKAGGMAVHCKTPGLKNAPHHPHGALRGRTGSDPSHRSRSVGTSGPLPAPPSPVPANLAAESPSERAVDALYGYSRETTSSGMAPIQSISVAAPRPSHQAQCNVLRKLFLARLTREGQLRVQAGSSWLPRWQTNKNS